jgi:hypothetical protein
MFAAAAGKSTLGIPKKVGQEFTSGFHGRPGSIKKLPARIERAKKTGLISPRAESRHMDVDATATMH